MLEKQGKKSFAFNFVLGSVIIHAIGLFVPTLIRAEERINPLAEELHLGKQKPRANLKETDIAKTSAPNIIANVVVRGNKNLNMRSILAYLPSLTGLKYTPLLANNNLKRLLATGLFKDAHFSIEGQTLVITVEETQTIGKIAYEGNLYYSDESLDGEVGLRSREPYSRERVRSASLQILRLYRLSGRLNAIVTPYVIERDSQRIDIVFEIVEGERASIAGIRFEGNNSFSDEELRGIIFTTESSWWRFLSGADNYDPDRMLYDAELIRRYYSFQGFADTNVVSRSAQLTKDGKKFFLVFSIDEGPIYSFGEATISSSKEDDEALQKLITHEKGALYNSALLEKTIADMQEFLQKKGYAFVRINPVIQEDHENLEVNISYDINHGPKVYVEDITVTGNFVTKDNVIRRALIIYEGSLFVKEELQESERNLLLLGIFEQVEIKDSPGSTPNSVRLTVRVKEQPTGNISIGIGYSTLGDFTGSLSFSEKNFLGRGWGINLVGDFTLNTQYISLTFTEPYLFDRDVSGTIQTYYRRQDYQQLYYVSDRVGSSFALSVPFLQDFTASLSFSFYANRLYDIREGATQDIIDEAEQGFTWRTTLGYSLSYNRLDRSVFPRSGYYLRFGQTVAIPPGENRYLLTEAQGRFYYTPYGEWTLSYLISGGYILGYGGQIVPVSDRFYKGGTTLRGFQLFGLGPRDTTTDIAIGANAFIINSVELNLPLPIPRELNLYARAFVDFGWIGISEVTKIENPNIEDAFVPRGSLGLSLIWLTPIGPLNFDFSYVFLKEEYDRVQNFRFSIGARL